MGIQEEIKQKQFKTSFDKAMVNLLYTHNWVRDLYKDIFQDHDIKPQHYNVLRILRGKHPDPCSPGEIKNVMLDKSPDLTRLLDKLTAMQLIDRNLCPTNRRMMDVHITKKGIKLLETLIKEEDKIKEGRRNCFSEEDAEQLSGLLDKFRK